MQLIGKTKTLKTSYAKCVNLPGAESANVVKRCYGLQTKEMIGFRPRLPIFREIDIENLNSVNFDLYNVFFFIKKAVSV